jgi:hypothetical protein
MARLRFGVLTLLGTLAMVDSTGFAQSPGDVRLADLTVPAVRLPEGCALPSIQAPDEPRRSWLPAGATNPWMPTELRDKARLLGMVEGAPRIPDGPPPTARESQYFSGRVIDQIEEAYAAVYTGAAEPEIRVVALRYATPAPSGLEAPRRAYRVTERFTSGRLVAVVDAPERGSCFDAVREHLRSVMTR